MTATGLIADIGATNARFALVQNRTLGNIQVLKCADHATIVDAARAYLAACGAPDVRVASFAIAGPVTGDHFTMTNHPWDFSIEQTRLALGLDHFTLMNDFKAVALAIPHLRETDRRQIGGTQTPVAEAPIAVIGPGTGLGVGALVWDGQAYRAIPGEGGHVTMPAKTQREFDVFQALHDKYRHISAERVCSGKGLVNIYNALRIIDHRNDLPDRSPEDISAAALNGSCALCAEALNMMIAFLGSIAGNLALTLGAAGGVYIAGGICAQLGEAFFQSDFRDQFESKGRFQSYLAPIPTYLITHPFIAFIGLQADVEQRLSA